MKCIFYVAMLQCLCQQYVHRHHPGHRLHMMSNFVEDCVDGLIADHQSTSIVHRRSHVDCRRHLDERGVHSGRCGWVNELKLQPRVDRQVCAVRFLT